MLLAIITAIIAALIIVGIVVAVFILRSRRAPKTGAAAGKRVQTLETVGVSSSLASKDASNGGTEVHASSGQTSVKNPADNLKSRFTALGIFAGVVFGSLTVKLWSMQVLSSSSYARDAEENRFTTVYTPAPRGYICDSSGIPLVKNRTSLTVLAEPSVAENRDLLVRLSAVLGVPLNVVRQRIQDASAGAQSQRTVASDVKLRDVAFISEHADAFPNISVQTRTVRDYPFGALAAHVLGYVGSVSEDELNNQPEGRDIKSIDDVGKSGVEATYDSLLAGDHGQRRVVVDAQGEVKEVASETQPTKGSDVYLTINGPLQYYCDRRLADLVAPDRGMIGSGKGVAAAVVAMDVRDGSIVAMASYPTYDPEKFIGGIPQDIWDLYNTEESHAPLNNRCVSGLYAAASTYKAVTGLAGLEYGFAGKDAQGKEMTWDCEGSWDGFDTGVPQKCWLHSGHGKQTFRDGIVNSCDVVFYNIAKDFFDHSKSEGGNLSDTALQEVIQKYNFGKLTGIDIAGEEEGRVPTPEWKAEYWRNVPASAQWTGGDYTNMIIGQGDVQVTPLQVAVAYGAIATGKLMKPHLFKEVHNAEGEVSVTYEPEVIGEPEVTLDHLNTVRDALHGVATENEEVAKLFRKHKIDAAAKTGTAEHTDKGDDAWFVCYAPYEEPKYVVACVVEQGGGGSAVAAPLGVDVMAKVLDMDAGELDATMGKIAGSTGKEVKDLDTAAASGGRTD